MNAPVTTTVISLEVPLPGGAARAEVTAGFERTVGAVATQLGAITKEQGGPQLTVTLSPDAPVALPLQRLANAIADFEALCPPFSVRGMVHYGVVFRSESAGKISYLGSAIRSSQSSLRRTELGSGLIATREFAAYARGFNPPLVPLEALGGTYAADGFCLVRLESKPSGAPGRLSGLTSADPEFLQFLKKRLAEDLGPFASAMVENARRTSATAATLVADLAREIDDHAARKKFEADLQAFIRSRSKT